MILKIVIFSALIASHCFGMPVPNGSPVLSLSDAVKKGLDYSQELKSAQSQIRGSEDDLARVRGSLFPTINGVASATNKQNSTTGTVQTPTTTATANGNTFIAGLALTQPLYAGGAISSGLSLYKTNEDLARQNFYQTKQTTIANVLSAYYNMALSEEILEAANQNRDILKAYEEITSHYERIGRSRHIDLMQAGVNYSLALVDVDQNETNLKNNRSILEKFLGEPNDKVFTSNFHVSVTTIETIPLNVAYEAGLKNNPSIRVLLLQAAQVSHNEDIDLATDKPSLNLIGTTGYQSPDTSTLFNNSSGYYSVGLNLTVPFFSGLSSISKKQGYEEKKYQTQRSLEIAKNNLRDQIQQSLSTIGSLRERLKISQDSVEKAREALDAANKGYRQGIASSIDVLNLQTTRYKAEQLYITTQYNYLQTLVTLRQLMGIDLEKVYVR